MSGMPAIADGGAVLFLGALLGFIGLVAFGVRQGTRLQKRQREAWAAMEHGESIEARVVKAADKIQMMAKALTYGRQQRGNLAEFWAVPKNFDDRGIPIARELFEAIARRAGREVPR